MKRLIPLIMTILLTPALFIFILSPQHPITTQAAIAFPQPQVSDMPSTLQGVDIQPLSDVYTNGPPDIINLTATHATLTFVSSIPLACSVVYGTTSDYGQIAVDADMGSGAHTDHQPLLVELQPETVYHYRVQGTAADGTIYASEDMTFETPPAETSHEINLASLANGASVIEVSSNFGGAANDDTWGANSGIDENPATAWSSAGDGDDAFIEIALTESAIPSAIDVWTRSMSNGTAQIFDFNVTANTGESFGPFTLPDASQAYRFDITPTEPIESLRLDVLSSNGGNTGLVEFAVYTPQLSYIYLPLTRVE